MATIQMMASTPGFAIFGVATSYLHNEISLHELHEWMARHTTWLMTAPKDDATELAGLVELNLAEIGLSHATEDDLRRELTKFFASHPKVTVHLDAGKL